MLKHNGVPLGGSRDFWPTPQEVADYVVAHCLPELPPRPLVLDTGAGTGVWGQATRKRFGANMFLVGVDIPGIKRPEGYDAWEDKTFEVFAKKYRGEQFDAAIGNPPYGGDKPEKWLFWLWNKLIKRDGYIIWLLRMAWAESERRFTNIFNGGMAPYMTYNSARRISFTGDGKTDATAYKVFVWKVGWNGYTNEGWARESWFDFQQKAQPVTSELF